MKKTEFAVGEIFQFGLKKLRVKECKGCDKCYINKTELFNCEEVLGLCSKSLRSDGKDVIFVEVEEE